MQPLLIVEQTFAVVVYTTFHLAVQSATSHKGLGYSMGG